MDPQPHLCFDSNKLVLSMHSYKAFWAPKFGTVMTRHLSSDSQSSSCIPFCTPSRPVSLSLFSLVSLPILQASAACSHLFLFLYYRHPQLVLTCFYSSITGIRSLFSPVSLPILQAFGAVKTKVFTRLRRSYTKTACLLGLEQTPRASVQVTLQLPHRVVA